MTLYVAWISSLQNLVKWTEDVSEPPSSSPYGSSPNTAAAMAATNRSNWRPDAVKCQSLQSFLTVEGSVQKL